MNMSQGKGSTLRELDERIGEMISLSNSYEWKLGVENCRLQRSQEPLEKGEKPSPFSDPVCHVALELPLVVADLEEAVLDGEDLRVLESKLDVDERLREARESPGRRPGRVGSRHREREGFAPLVHEVAEGLRHGRDAMLCLLYTSPSPRDATLSRMPSSA